jgi:hypothetical protein
MLDTIDMLETIGSDASLRYASAVELTNVLERAQATEALTAAVTSGDASYLVMEFGGMRNFAPQSSQTFLSSYLG